MTPKFSGLPALATLLATVLAAGLTTGTKGGDDSPIKRSWIRSSPGTGPSASGSGPPLRSRRMVGRRWPRTPRP